MSLGASVSFTPWNKVSFGYSDIINADYSGTFQNATDIVIVEITYVSGPFDDESHISTPSSGSAVSTYDKQTKTFRVKGQRSDVDAVLNLLNFFPSPDGYNTNWTVPLTLRINSTTQITQSPPSITTTQLRVKVLDGSTEVANVTKDFVPVQPTYVYYHPYITSSHPTESVSTGVWQRLDFSDFGTNNMSDRNFTITAEAYATFTNNWSFLQTDCEFDWDEFYIGDKKPETPQGSELFRFTGNINECQSFLDNIMFRANTASTRNLKISMTDGLSNNAFNKQVT